MRVAILEEDGRQTTVLINMLSRISIGDAVISPSAFDSGTRLRAALRHETYDLLILAWNAPDLDGIDLLQWLRNFQKSEVPVIMLTSRNSEQDIAKALGKGADDYLVKPVRPLEFSARVARLLQRRSGTATSPQLVFGAWTFDRSTTSVRLARAAGDKRIELTEREFRLALALFQHLGSTLSRSHLLEYSGVSGEELRSRALDSHMYRLRNKLFREHAYGMRLKTIYGHGYRLEQLTPAEDRSR